MVKKKYLSIEISLNQEKLLTKKALNEGFFTKSSYIRSLLFKDIKPEKKEKINMTKETNLIEERRSERRSFNCPNILWRQLEEITAGKTSISSYIREAIKEKIRKEEKNILNN